uniref:Protein arginine methyltransferase NDUFAF7 n=1 Tax=Lygus hesperus TaxID=30085 RepID=A0A0A9YLD4_LYGHE
MLGPLLRRTLHSPNRSHFRRVEKAISRCYSEISLKTRIEVCGPISVADYMKEVLTHPRDGYYMQRDVFGTAGDFITSPEISQLFGEMIAVWLLNEWQKIGSPKPFHLVELGPGRGTMMKDILRVLNKLKIGGDTVEVHLVEVSEELSKIQATNLCVDHQRTPQSRNDTFHQRGLTSEGIEVFWHHSCTLIPKEFSVVVAHEFFDALPIHKFQKTPNGWREVLVDIDPKNPGRLRFVLSDKPTPASVLLVKKNEKKVQVEISPLSGVIMGQLAQHLEAYGGFALVQTTVIPVTKETRLGRSANINCTTL